MKALRTILFLLPAAFVACIDGLVLPGDAEMILTAAGAGTGARFGHAVELGFHADTNYYEEIAVGEPASETVYVFDHAAGSFDTTDAVATFVGESGGEAGWSLTSGFLVGAVSYRDLVIGAPSENGGAGRVYILEGTTASGTLGPADAYATIEGRLASDFAGWDVAVGDFNGDGYHDVLVGICGRKNFHGAVSVVFGPFTNGEVIDVEDPTRVLLLKGTPTDGSLGCSVAAGDTDDNGRSELIAGSPGFTTSSTTLNGDLGGGQGRVWVGYNSLSVGSGRIDDTSLINTRHWTGVEAGQAVGYAVDGDGDVNGDGIDDLLVGANYFWCEQLEHGVTGAACAGRDPAAFLLFGEARLAGNRIAQVSGDIDAAADVTIEGVDNDGGFGTSAEIVGDHNDDDHDDLVVGTMAEAKSYVFYGVDSPAASFTSDEAWGVVDGSATNENLGQAAAGDYDLDKDGRAEILLGEAGVEFTEDPNYVGAAYLFHGAE